MTHTLRLFIACSLAVCLLLPAAASADELKILAEDLSLLDDDALFFADGDSALHPTNYPHRHRRRVRRVRRVRHPPAPVRRFGDDRTSVYFGIGGLGNFFIQGSNQLSRVYEGGGGFSLQFGARFNRFFALELAYMAAFQNTQSTAGNINTGTVQAVSIDGKVFVMPGSSRIEPFLQLGIGAYILSEALRHELTGVGFEVGGGVDIRFSHFFAVGARLLYRGFFVDNSDATYNAIPTESAFLNAITAEANVQFHF